jgi:protein phosphatase
MLLCSDGFHGVLDLDQLRIILQNTTDVDATARGLVETALENGARDNVTALVVRYEVGR